MKKFSPLFSVVASCCFLLVLCTVFIISKNAEEQTTPPLPCDISESFAENEIKYLVSLGVLETQSSGDNSFFFPTSNVTREYFARSIVSIFGLNTADYDSFSLNIADETDVPKESLPYIRAAVATGLMDTAIIDGKEYFLPNSPLSREEAADILGSLSTAVIASTRSTAFSDIDSAEQTYIENLTKLIDLEVLIGYPDGTIKPKSTLTREELAVMLWRVLQNKIF